MEMWIVVDERQGSVESIAAQLRSECPDDAEVQLSVKQPNEEFRGADPATIVAVVAAAGTAFGALIGGMLRICEQVSAQKIVLRGKGGLHLEVPADTSSEKLDELIGKLRELDQEKIKITIS